MNVGVRHLQIRAPAAKVRIQYPDKTDSMMCRYTESPDVGMSIRSITSRALATKTPPASHHRSVSYTHLTLPTSDLV